MKWKLAAAKQQLSKVVQQAAEEPQVLFNREKPVAAVISAEEFEDFLEWRKGRQGSIAEALSEAQRICEEDDYRLDVQPRVDRDNPLLTEKPRVPRRHQRRQ